MLLPVRRRDRDPHTPPSKEAEMRTKGAPDGTNRWIPARNIQVIGQPHMDGPATEPSKGVTEPAMPEEEDNLPGNTSSCHAEYHLRSRFKE